MKLKSDYHWLDRGLLVVIILELLALLAVKLMYLPFNKADFHNTIIPIISAAGFMAVIVSIWYIKKGNDERLSQEYYNFYIEKIEKYKQRMNNEKLSSFIFAIKIKKTYSIYDFTSFLMALSHFIKADTNYEEDIRQIKNGKELGINYFQQRSYFQPLFDMVRLVETVSGYARSNHRLLEEIMGHRKLADYHIELLSRQILSELLKEYLLACNRHIPTSNQGEIVDIFQNDKGKKVINSFFFFTYQIIKKDKRLNNFLSSEGIILY